VDDRRDVFDTLLGGLTDTDRPRVLDRIRANNPTQLLKIITGRVALPGTRVGIFTSRPDRVTTIRILAPAGLAATALSTALDHGMHSREPLLVVDLGGVSLLESAGVGVLVEAASLAARRGIRITVRRASPAVVEELSGAGLGAMLDVPPICLAPRKASPVSPADTVGKQESEGDLDRIKGIGAKYRAILEEVGVASIKELRHRNARNLKAMIEERHGPVVGLTELQVQTWIDRARATGEPRPDPI
jgi:anti-anti-sigma factor